tara:strand:+ start:1437 stop:2081 length:645 start_codon:yes stop_codon:yes gene_type:complete
MHIDPFRHAGKKYKVFGYSISEKEINDLFKAWIIISVAFAFILGTRSILSVEFMQNLVISLVAVGTGFVFHELAHKAVAQKYGCFAEFRANMSMLWFALIIAYFAGIVFAAPGAVMISGYVNKRINGKISLAGPLTNMILAVLFLGLSVYVSLEGLDFLAIVFGYGFMINTWLGLFNLLPFGNFDGIKILRWNKVYYGLIVAFGLVLLSVQMLA